MAAYQLIVSFVPQRLAGKVLLTSSAFDAFACLKKKYGKLSRDQIKALTENIERKKLDRLEVVVLKVSTNMWKPSSAA